VFVLVCFCLLLLTFLSFFEALVFLVFTFCFQLFFFGGSLDSVSSAACLPGNGPYALGPAGADWSSWRELCSLSKESSQWGGCDLLVGLGGVVRPTSSSSSFALEESSENHGFFLMKVWFE